MKNLILFLLFAATNAAAIASTIDSHTFPIFGTETEENFLLNSTQTRTAYRQETVARTCFRTEASGYRTVCDYNIEVTCSNRVCAPASVYRCQQVVNYMQVPYTCYQNVSTPYEVADHQVVANFDVKVTMKPKEPTNPTSCSVGFILEGDILKSNADCKNYLIFANQLKTTEVDHLGTVIHNYSVSLKLLDKEETLAPLDGGLSDMHLEGHTLIFKTGDLSKNSNFNLKLFVERRHLLKSDETLINRNITPKEYTFEKTNDHLGIVKVDLDKLLGGMNDQKKHIIKVDMNIVLEAGTLLNNQSVVFKKDASITVN